MLECAVEYIHIGIAQYKCPLLLYYYYYFIGEGGGVQITLCEPKADIGFKALVSTFTETCRKRYLLKTYRFRTMVALFVNIVVE